MAVTESELVERLARRRARMLPVLALAFVAQQASFFVVSRFREPPRTVDYVQAGAWLFLGLVILAAVATGGFWFRSARVRALLDDENTRSNRLDAMRLGFVSAMLAAILLYAVALFEAMTAREVVHIIVTAGLAASLLRFGFLERRAMRDG